MDISRWESRSGQGSKWTDSRRSPTRTRRHNSPPVEPTSGIRGMFVFGAGQILGEAGAKLPEIVTAVEAALPARAFGDDQTR